MTPSGQLIVRLYTMALRLYPPSFRTSFEEEMRVVFAEAVAEAAAYGRMALLAVCLRELKDWPESLLREHWSSQISRVKEVIMSQVVGENDIPGLVPAQMGSVTRFVAGMTERRPLIKRAFDIVFAAFGLVAAAPLFVVLIVLVKLDSPGPVFFRQKRVGQGGHLFTLLKFRSMVCGADRVGLTANGVEKGSVFDQDGHDPRLTGVGRIIRKLKVDELPQLVNVLKGEMSLLGPRPELPTR
jgi:hypothetical protein